MSNLRLLFGNWQSAFCGSRQVSACFAVLFEIDLVFMGDCAIVELLGNVI